MTKDFKKISKVLFSVHIFILIVSLGSCKFFEQLSKFDNYVESLEFKQGKNYVDEEDCIVLYLTVNPTDSFQYYKTEYSVSDDSIASFEECTDSYCIVRGKKEGSTIVSAKVGSRSAKTVVTVRKVNK